MSISRDELEEKADGIVSYLEASLERHGRFRTLRRFHGRVESYVEPTEFPGWYDFGDCPFAAANVAYHLRTFEAEPLVRIRRRLCETLLSALEEGVARYLVRHEAPIPFPADVDDTVLVAVALRSNGYPVALNLEMILGNFDSAGNPFTWLVPRARHLRSPGALLWLLKDARRRNRQMASFGTPRSKLRRIAIEYRDSSEPAIAANVLLCPKVRACSPPSVSALLRRIGADDMPQQYYGSRIATWFHLARLHHSGVDAVGTVRSRAMRELADVQAEDGSLGNPLLTAIATLAAIYFGERGSEFLERSLRNLLDLPFHETGWVPFPYCNDRDGVFDDGGAELTAAFILEAFLRAPSE